MFELEGIKYNDILDIKQLKIPSHQITSIVGESGSGKTTLLKLLNKMVCSTQGEIYYNNRPLSSIDAISLRREVVMLPQTPAIYTGTVKDNLLIGLKFSESPLVDDDKLIEILKIVHLNKPLEENADNLSGGEKQRLALGRIILLDSQVFLLDEPSSALDEETEKNIIEQFVHFSKKYNKTLIMVTHSKKVAKDYSDYIVEIKNGKVISQKGAS